MKVAIGSLKFSPVFKSHCIALGRQCEKAGIDVVYLFSKKYDWMLTDDIRKKSVFIETSTHFSHLILDYGRKNNISQLKKIIEDGGVSYIYMFNYHPLNHLIAHLAKDNNIKYIQHLHELSVDPINYKFGYGYLVQFLYKMLIYLLLKETAIVIVSSNKILMHFNSVHSQFSGKVMLIPLIYMELDKEIEIDVHRHYVTFMGPPIRSKNMELFLDIVKYCYQNNLNYDFLIISRKKISVPPELSSKLNIFYRSEIKDEEIASLINRSIAMVTPYTNISQSSNVNTSYRYGTPILASDIPGLRQFVLPGKTGFLIDLKSPLKNWINALDIITKNQADMSKNCIDYYNRNFAEPNWVKYIDKLFV